jgi:hypothetical protein
MLALPNKHEPAPGDLFPADGAISSRFLHDSDEANIRCAGAMLENAGMNARVDTPATGDQSVQNAILIARHRRIPRDFSGINCATVHHTRAALGTGSGCAAWILTGEGWSQ